MDEHDASKDLSAVQLAVQLPVELGVNVAFESMNDSAPTDMQPDLLIIATELVNVQVTRLNLSAVDGFLNV